MQVNKTSFEMQQREHQNLDSSALTECVFTQSPILNAQPLETSCLFESFNEYGSDNRVRSESAAKF